eukprot:CAMPEP_0113472138 /NCGR_PEP_ID=MMETSP0014_2-20120614/17354_1 /TAXON_ID=2857 /ORGANISM="Nitzschia sp." /LENGTH=272 /DNA_ID=CAMNT_0000364825 /DNA_START=363 /DNA_END=1177 /DNA_ORIENTATION=+ /assembly_acc=CAM_ASM_000159
MATKTTTSTAVKGKAIDTFLNESPVSPQKKKVGSVSTASLSSSSSTVVSWPDESDDKNNKTKLHENEEDLYGYGVAEPTPKSPSAARGTPRRSSLKTGGAGGGGRRPRGSRRASIGYTGEMTLVLPTGETKKKRTSISFAESAVIKEVQPVSDMVEDSKRLWFQSSEYEGIQEKIFDMVEEAKKSQKDKTAKPSWVDLRGLEPVLDRSVAESRKEATSTLIDEQNALKMQGTYDQEYLRDMYMFHSVDAQIRAEERAGKDAKEVEEYLKLTR